MHFAFFLAACEPMTTLVEPSTPSVNWKLSAQDRESYERVFSSVLISYAAIRIEQEIGQGETQYC